MDKKKSEMNQIKSNGQREIEREREEYTLINIERKEKDKNYRMLIQQYNFTDTSIGFRQLQI